MPIVATSPRQGKVLLQVGDVEKLELAHAHST